MSFLVDLFRESFVALAHITTMAKENMNPTRNSGVLTIGGGYFWFPEIENVPFHVFYHVPFLWKGRGQHSVIKMKVQGWACLKIWAVIGRHGSWMLSCLGSHWSEQVYSPGLQWLDYRGHNFSPEISTVLSAIKPVFVNCDVIHICKVEFSMGIVFIMKLSLWLVRISVDTLDRCNNHV